jgi:hypothetical protein
MTTFTVTITNTDQLAGITAARNDYNTSNSTISGFIPITLDADYVTFVLTSAAASYASHYNT